MPGHGGGPFAFTGFGLGVAFGGCGVARGVARGVGAGVTRGVGAGVTRGVGAGVTRGVGSGVGFAVGAAVGGLPGTPVAPAAGRGVGALGPSATTPLGSGVADGLTLADGSVDGDGVETAGDPGGEVVVGVGVGVGPDGVADGRADTTGVGEITATSPGGVRGAPKPTARAKVARTRLRTPRATTNRARWAEVTSLFPSLRPAFVGRSALSRTREC